MQFFIVSFLFVLGGAFGSFLNVLLERIPKKRSIMGRSSCDYCHKKISSFDLIPVFSYVLLKGRCRFCSHKIGLKVFLIEVISAVIFPLAYLFAFMSIFQYFLLLIILLTILAISAVDIEKGIIPDELLLILGLAAVMYVILANPQLLLQHVFTALVSFAFFLFIYVLTRGRGIGFGDVKYAFFIGFILSLQQLIIAFYAAFLTGAFISIILIVLGIKKVRGSSVPFGPFLSFGLALSLLFEKELMNMVRLFFP